MMVLYRLDPVEYAFCEADRMAILAIEANQLGFFALARYLKEMSEAARKYAITESEQELS